MKLRDPIQPRVWYVRTRAVTGKPASKAEDDGMTELKFRPMRDDETRQEVAERLKIEYKNDANFRLVKM